MPRVQYSATSPSFSLCTSTIRKSIKRAECAIHVLTRGAEKKNYERTSFHITHFPPIIVPRFSYTPGQLKNSIHRFARDRPIAKSISLLGICRSLATKLNDMNPKYSDWEKKYSYTAVFFLLSLFIYRFNYYLLIYYYFAVFCFLCHLY